MNSDRTLTQSLVRVLLITAGVLAVPLVAMRFVEGEGWSVFDYALVAALVGGTGALYELAMKRPATRTSAVVTAVLAAIGGAAMIVGEVDDAPGLILLGLVMVVTAVVVGVRTVRRGNGAAGATAGSP